MKASQIIAQLDRTGGVVYPDGKNAAVFSYAGIRDGWVWFHRGDYPHWGPREADLQVFSDTSVGRKIDGKIAFFMTSPEDSPEIERGRVMIALDAHRAAMTREQAEAMLGSTPTSRSETTPPETQVKEAPPEDDTLPE